MDIVDLIESVSKINLEQAANDTISKTEKELADFNRAQLKQGQRSDNEKVHWLKDSHYPYVKPYARKRQKMGLQTDVVDLNVTNTFYDSIDAKQNAEDIIFDGHSDKAKYQEEHYSNKIYGITDENLEKYTESTFEPKFFEELNLQSGLF
jgi:hypothetical protein